MNLKHDIDFYSVYLQQQKAQKKEARARGSKLPMFVAAGVVLVGGAYAFLAYGNSQLQAQKTQLENDLYATNLMEKYGTLQTMQGKYQEIKYYNELVDTVHSVISDRPMLEKDVYTAAAQALTGMGKMTGLGQKEEKLTIHVELNKPGNAADYADALQATGLFQDVSYYGWEEDGIYTADFICTMKEAANR